MAACRRSSRLAPLVSQKLAAPCDVSKKLLLPTTVKVEPCVSLQEARAQGVKDSLSSSSLRNCKIGRKKETVSRTKFVDQAPPRKLDKITGSFKVVKQEVCQVDKNIGPEPPHLPGLRQTRKVKSEDVEATDDIKIYVSRARKKKLKTEGTPLDGSNVCPGNNKEMKRDSSDAATLVTAKEETCSADKVETSKEITSLAIVPSSNLSGQAVELAVTSGSPYPDFARPYPEECYEVRNRLSQLHGTGSYARGKSCPTIDPLQVLALEYHSEEVTAADTAGALVVSEVEEQKREDEHEDRTLTGCPSVRRTVLDSLVGTILSQNTTDNNSRKAFASLKQAFPTWEEVHAADPKKVEDAIRCGGLAETKAKRIINILDTIFTERGSICLEYVRSMNVDQIKAELSRFKGVGPKTVRATILQCACPMH
uniref:HhH-GPD domain-containing protein n=1 Tax=Physcomitrium patens TaxID=3218 RepID=A0A7I4D411_PHYPA